MKTQLFLLCSVLFLSARSAVAQGSLLTYQGLLTDGTNPANGNYEILFRPFAVSTGGTQSAFPNIRFVAVSNGLFTTTISFGDTIFDGNPVFLQLEVRTNGAPGYTIVTPRQQLTPAPYAIFSSRSAGVTDGAIGSAQLANSINLGTSNLNGRLDVYRNATGTPAISLVGSSSQLSAYGGDGQEKARLSGGSWGLLYLNNGQPSNDRSVTLGSLTSQGGGFLSLANTGGATRVSVNGDSTGGGGGLVVYDANGTSTVELNGAEGANSGSQLVMKQANGTTTIQLDAEVGNGGGGYLRLYKGDGTTGLTLQADVNGESKVTTQVLQITGGSDLSEQFDISAAGEELSPGMVVCIDAAHPGQLARSTKPYDRTVAGVMSGAGGVKPGLLMGQPGTVADGKHPVALSGRVFCEADVSNGAIQPGDLLTTSNRPGHAMKVTDYDKAHGAIIGKAMSALEKGDGLVLVLVSLQ